jgi:hypothetical protein
MQFRSAVLLTATALCLIGCRDEATTQQAVVQPSAPTATTIASSEGTSSHQFGVFSFSIPDGWTVVAPDREKTKAMILLDGTHWQDARAMIKVDVGTPTAPTARQLAEGFANSTGGKCDVESLEFDGTPGVSVSTTSTTLTTPRDMIVIYRDGKAYLLMAGAVEGVDLSEAVAQIRKSWKWTGP